MNTFVHSLLALIPTAVVFAPILHYVRKGWPARRREIASCFSDKVVKEYVQVFFGDRADVADEEYRSFFDRSYARRFGRAAFWGPCLVLFVIVYLCAYSAIEEFVLKRASLLQMGDMGIYALFGAFAWIVTELTDRARRIDLSPYDVYEAAFRLLVAVPMGYAFAELFNDQFGGPVALVVGGFPTRHLLRLLRGTVASKVGLDEGGYQIARELEQLQGITRAESERLGKEGVATILQLAYADPVELTMRTGFSFGYVVECCSQALAWLVFGAKLKKFREFGVRGALEVRRLVLNLDMPAGEEPDGTSAAKEQACAVRAQMAQEVGMEEAVLENALCTLARDMQTVFLYEAWCPEWD